MKLNSVKSNVVKMLSKFSFEKKFKHSELTKKVTRKTYLCFLLPPQLKYEANFFRKRKNYENFMVFEKFWKRNNLPENVKKLHVKNCKVL